MREILAQVPQSGPETWTALGIVGSVVGFFLWKFQRTDADERSDRLAEREQAMRLAAEKDTALADARRQHQLKHEALNALAVERGRIVLVRRYAKICTCGALDPIRLLLDPEDA